MPSEYWYLIVALFTVIGGIVSWLAAVAVCNRRIDDLKGDIRELNERLRYLEQNLMRQGMAGTHNNSAPEKHVKPVLSKGQKIGTQKATDVAERNLTESEE